MENNLIIELNQEYGFYEVTCPEGYYITDYDPSKDINEFNCSALMYFPGAYTAEKIQEQYHLITETEKEGYLAKQEAMKQNRKKMINYGSN